MNTEILAGRNDIGSGEEMIHVVHLHDPNLALCGADRSGRPWAPRDAETDCVVCADLLAAE